MSENESDTNATPEHVACPEIDTSIFVDEYYEMDPETEDLLSVGSKLQNGMRVLIEDAGIKTDIERINKEGVMQKYALRRARENNRWCTVTELRVDRQLDYDESGYGRDNGARLVSFVGVYDDGVKMKRTFSDSYAWIVKLDSVPVPRQYNAPGCSCTYIVTLERGTERTLDEHCSIHGELPDWEKQLITGQPTEQPVSEDDQQEQTV